MWLARLVTLLVLMVGASACGASSDLDGHREPATEEEACLVEPDAEWTTGNCGGAFDRCDLGSCEQHFGEGCSCPDPGMCWDGSECVPE